MNIQNVSSLMNIHNMSRVIWIFIVTRHGNLNIHEYVTGDMDIHETRHGWHEYSRARHGDMNIHEQMWRMTAYSWAHVTDDWISMIHVTSDWIFMTTRL